MNKDVIQEEIDKDFIKTENKYKIIYERLEDISPELLLDFRYEIDLVNFLCQFCIDDNIDAVRKIINMGVDGNLKHKRHKITPLMYACIHCSYESAEFLIEWGVDVNTKNNRGETALIWAIGNNNKRMIDLLIQNGAHE